MNTKEHLGTFLANLAHAVRNRETVSVGGGEFTHTELAAVLADITRMRDEQERTDDDAIDGINGALFGGRGCR